HFPHRHRESCRIAPRATRSHTTHTAVHQPTPCTRPSAGHRGSGTNKRACRRVLRLCCAPRGGRRSRRVVLGQARSAGPSAAWCAAWLGLARNQFEIPSTSPTRQRGRPRWRVGLMSEIRFFASLIHHALFLSGVVGVRSNNGDSPRTTASDTTYLPFASI